MYISILPVFSSLSLFCFLADEEGSDRVRCKQAGRHVHNVYFLSRLLNATTLPVCLVHVMYIPVFCREGLKIRIDRFGVRAKQLDYYDVQHLIHSFTVSVVSGDLED